MKYAIVTGASKGVGKKTAELLSENGYRVIAVSRNKKKLQSLASDKIEIYQLDLTDFNSIKNFWEEYHDTPIDLIVNNAGGGSSPTLIDLESPYNFNYAYSLNVSGPMYLSQLFIPNMKNSENPCIIFISSLGGRFPYRGGGNYTISKRALGGMIETMRMEFPKYKIRVTEICPGSIDTVDEENREIALKAEDLAQAIIWISSLPRHLNVNYIEMNHILSDRY